jgi:Acetyltransferase (GNAT) domain
MSALSTWSLQTSASIPARPNLRHEWRDLLNSSDDIFALYQSSEWFDQMRAREDALRRSQSLAVRRNSHGRLTAVVPFYITESGCTFAIAGGRSYTPRLKAVTLMSVQLLMRPKESMFDALFDAIVTRYPRDLPVRIDYIPVNGQLYDYLKSSHRIQDRYFVYQVPGLTGVHAIPLTATYEQFLAQYSGKKRYNLRRQLQLLRQYTDGRLELRRCDSAESVSEIVDSVLNIRRAAGNKIIGGSDRNPRSWYSQQIRAEQALANLGLQRSYILWDGERPISCIRGCQFGRTFYMRKTDHDPAYDRFSPGTALLQLVIQDLIKDKRFGLINLGWGHPSYKHHTAHQVVDYALVWLFPVTWRNRLIRSCYRGFRRTVSSLKVALKFRAKSGDNSGAIGNPPAARIFNPERPPG